MGKKPRAAELSEEERAKRRAMRTASADMAMQDHADRERHKSETLERLRAERLARAGKDSGDE